MEKTFNIGECCQGGVITAIATKEQVKIIAKEWDFSSGSNRSSNQKNAKEFMRIEVSTQDSNAKMTLDNFLNNLTTCYYADQVLNWVESKTKLENSFF